MGEWQATVDFTTMHAVEGDQLFDVIEVLSVYGASADMLPDGTGAGVTLRLEAESALDAAGKAVGLVAGSAVFAGISVVSVEATEWSLAVARLDEPAFPPVVGYAEMPACPVSPVRGPLAFRCARASPVP